jgi:glycosyltransferase involved in cell wall biosynthesis
MPAEHRAPPPMLVALDVTPLLGRKTGIAMATEGMLDALSQRPEVSLEAYAVSVRGRQGLEAAVAGRARIGQRVMPARPLMAAWSRVSHPRIERFIEAPAVVHGTNFTVPPSKDAARVVSVWDLTFARYPELCQPATLRFRRHVARALATGAVVHTASSVIAEEVRAEFGARRDQVCVVPLGIPPLPAADVEGARRIIDPAVPYVLSIGTAEPRKDLPTLVAAFDELAGSHPDLELVLVGAPGWGEAELEAAIAAAAHRNRIRRTGYLADATVAGLLQAARVLCYPSRYEGFGFPPLQAMAAGVPVVSTRAGSLTEVLGGAALLVDPGQVDDLAGCLEVAAFDEAQRSVLVAAGSARTGDFSWERTAEGLVALYQRLVAAS